VTETHQQDNHEDTIAWVRALAATSLQDSPLPDAQVLWWKAQALRRLDRERAAMAPLDLGEFALIGGGIVAALALFAWLLTMPEVRTSPSFVVAATMSVAILFFAAAATLWETTRASSERTVR
jgi:hypothetical protein